MTPIQIVTDPLRHPHDPQAGLIVGLGYNGRGVAMPNAMGRVTAARILAARPADLPFRVTRMAGILLRNLMVMDMKRLICAMKLLDYLEIR